MATRFRWITEWKLDAPAAEVWSILSDAERYPDWWPGFRSVRIESGSGGVGTVSNHLVDAGPGLRLKFRMTVEERRNPEYVRMAVAGDSSGLTEWHVRDLGDGAAAVTHVWEIELRRPLLRAFAAIPGSGAFFERRHRATMARGRTNLARLLSEARSTANQGTEARNTRDRGDQRLKGAV